MTPTIGWTMTVVALVSLSALWLSMRRRKQQPTFTPTPRQTVEISVDEESCDIGTFAVEPWHVYVTRGKPLKWDFVGPANSKWKMRITADDPGKWPFPSPPPSRSVGPGGSIPAGSVKGNSPLNSKHKYMIVLECDGRTVRLDPDVYVYN